MLKESDYEWAAQSIGCQVAAVKAFEEVESKGSGFWEDGTPQTLFEAHHFSRFTDGRYDSRYPSISSRTWDRKLYRLWKAEQDRLALAASLDREAALKSASWGKFQIMGFNWKACGFASLQDFINAMYTERGQLEAFVGFIKAMRLQKWMNPFTPEKLAEIYNGKGYKSNDYHRKLARAFEKFGGV